MLLVKLKTSNSRQFEPEVQVNTEALFLIHFLSFALLSPPYVSFIFGHFFHGHKIYTFATGFRDYIYRK